MKQAKAIIYDDNCPMCRWYTRAFVETNLLDKEGRISFSGLEHTHLAEQMDLQRSKHEIPLVDLEGGATIYGVDSLIYLLSPRFPFLKKIMELKPLNYFFRKLYKLVSYNRGIMAPSPKKARVYDCTPDFNLTYRLTFIGLAGGIGFLLLSLFFHAGLMNVSWLFVLLLLLLLAGNAFKGNDYVSYLGHLSVLLLLGGLISLPALAFPVFIPLVGTLALSVMVWQFIRRYKLLKAS